MSAVKFKSRDGATMFAFSVKTDPDEVLRELAWAWPGGQHLCNWPCPRSDGGGYCLDCHAVGYEALAEARRRVGGNEPGATP